MPESVLPSILPYIGGEFFVVLGWSCRDKVTPWEDCRGLFHLTNWPMIYLLFISNLNLAGTIHAFPAIGPRLLALGRFPWHNFY